MSTRDTQKSRVYAWERAVVGDALYKPEFATLEECADYMTPIWRKERGRVGRAKVHAPLIERPSWGQRSAIAHHGDRWDYRNGKHVRTGGKITLPRWARSRWVILHEMAHRLTPGDAHGPRFVGVLMGLVCRWLDYDADQLMAKADELGVKYWVRSVGVVPVHGTVWMLRRALKNHQPMTAMDLASWLSIGEGFDVTVRQVRAGAMHLIKSGEARWLRGKLVSLESLPLAA